MESDKKIECQSSASSSSDRGYGDFSINVSATSSNCGLSEEAVQRLVNSATWGLLDKLKDLAESEKSESEFPAFQAMVVQLFLRAGLRPSYVEEVDNEYDPNGVNWISVYSNIGPIVVGWRRHVIHLSWADSTLARHPNNNTAEEIFPGEDVTKLQYGIHAYGYPKLGEYLGVLAKRSSLTQDDVGLGKRTGRSKK